MKKENNDHPCCAECVYYDFHYRYCNNSYNYLEEDEDPYSIYCSEYQSIVYEVNE